MNVPAGQQEVSDWLATDEGHAWLDKQATKDGLPTALGLTGQPWISLKEEQLGARAFYVASWYPADPQRLYRDRTGEGDAA